jgi:hypothetical protein
MLGTDKSRGYCLEMISADFLAGAHLDNGDPEILLNSISRYYRFLPSEHQRAFSRTSTSEGIISQIRLKQPCRRLYPKLYEQLWREVL